MNNREPKRATGKGQSTSCLAQKLMEDGFTHIPIRAIDVGGVLEGCRAFFELTREEKLKYAFGFTGYAPYGAEHSGDPARPDMIESYTISSQRRGEAGPPELHSLRSKIFLPGARACADLCRGLYLEYGDGPEVDDPPFEYWMQVNYFPPTERLPVTAKGDTRMGAHLDPGFITLFPAGVRDDFEYRDKEGAWRSPDHVERMAIFSGSLFERLTNGTVAACLHRVRLPSNPRAPRLSFAMTSTPRRDANLCPFRQFQRPGEKSQSFSGKNYMQARLNEVMVGASYRRF